MQSRPQTMTRTLDLPVPALRMLWMGVLAFAFLLAQALIAHARPESLAPLAEKISPAVVNITTSTMVEGRTVRRGSSLRGPRSRISFAISRTEMITIPGRGGPRLWGLAL